MKEKLKLTLISASASFALSSSALRLLSFLLNFSSVSGVGVLAVGASEVLSEAEGGVEAEEAELVAVDALDDKVN